MHRRRNDGLQEGPRRSPTATWTRRSTCFAPRVSPPSRRRPVVPPTRASSAATSTSDAPNRRARRGQLRDRLRRAQRRLQDVRVRMWREHIANSGSGGRRGSHGASRSRSATGRSSRYLGETVSKIGENMGVARFVRYELGSERGRRDRLRTRCRQDRRHGRDSQRTSARLLPANRSRPSAKDVAMQIAAAAPIAVDRDDVDRPMSSSTSWRSTRRRPPRSASPRRSRRRSLRVASRSSSRRSLLSSSTFVKDTDITVEQVPRRVLPRSWGRIDLGRSASSGWSSARVRTTDE